jgi:hypothetical protein
MEMLFTLLSALDEKRAGVITANPGSRKTATCARDP